MTNRITEYPAHMIKPNCAHCIDAMNEYIEHLTPLYAVVDIEYKEFYHLLTQEQYDYRIMTEESMEKMTRQNDVDNLPNIIKWICHTPTCTLHCDSTPCIKEGYYANFNGYRFKGGREIK